VGPLYSHLVRPSFPQRGMAGPRRRKHLGGRVLSAVVLCLIFFASLDFKKGKQADVCECGGTVSCWGAGEGKAGPRTCRAVTGWQSAHRGGLLSYEPDWFCPQEHGICKQVLRQGCLGPAPILQAAKLWEDPLGRRLKTNAASGPLLLWTFQGQRQRPV
jgi:hypothetical protein